MGKLDRACYFKRNTWIKACRYLMGKEVFDSQYRQLYRYISTLNVGDYFVVSKLCVKNPANHGLVVAMCDLYHHMDFFVDLRYDPETDRVTMHQPLYNMPAPYHPPDVYSKIVANPELWGVDPAYL